jgi:hypothetical protein
MGAAGFRSQQFSVSHIWLGMRKKGRLRGRPNSNKWEFLFFSIISLLEMTRIFLTGTIQYACYNM